MECKIPGSMECTLNVATHTVYMATHLYALLCLIQEGLLRSVQRIGKYILLPTVICCYPLKILQPTEDVATHQLQKKFCDVAWWKIQNLCHDSMESQFNRLITLSRHYLFTLQGSYTGSVAGTLIAGYLCEFSDWSWVFYLFGKRFIVVYQSWKWTGKYLSVLRICYWKSKIFELQRLEAQKIQIRNSSESYTKNILAHTGVIALMWVVVWQVLVTDSPEEDWHISTAEKNMILDSLEEDGTSKLVICSHKKDWNWK